jgi:stearoyl-CoA desaturase (delta-9 desaturase)
MNTVTDTVAAPTRAPSRAAPKSRVSLALIAFYGLHLLPLAAIWTGVRPVDVIVCVALYWIRMFGVTGAYHRYFSHRTFKTSRAFQLVLAVLAMSSSQKGVLWWAAHHRHHHKHSDTELDIHSPRQSGLYYAHVGWMLGTEHEGTDTSKILDFAKYPELRFLNRHWWIPPAALALVVFLTLGWSGLLIGFMASTVLLWHGTFTINSLTHRWGKQVYETGDDSRNSFFLAIITMGEGWHNNHHYYQACAPQGFHWWQFDPTYYVLRMLSWVGLIWDIRMPPRSAIEGKFRAGFKGSSERASSADAEPSPPA